MFVDQKKLNYTLVIDSPFQTIAVGLLLEFIGYISVLVCSPETLSLSSKSRIFLYNVHLALFVWIDDILTCTNTLVSIVI